MLSNRLDTVALTLWQEQLVLAHIPKTSDSPSVGGCFHISFIRHASSGTLVTLGPSERREGGVAIALI